MTESSSRCTSMPCDKRHSRGVVCHRVLCCIAPAILVIAYRHILGYYYTVWTQPDSYYSHGPLVPILAVVMVWQDRARLKDQLAQGSLCASVLILIACVAYCVGLALEFQFLCSLSLLLSIVSISLACIGRRATVAIAVPILFLVMMMPPPEGVLDKGTQHLQIISSTAAAKILDLAIGGVQQQGNVIHALSLPEPLVVAGACSGQKLLIAVLMCGWFISHIFRGQSWQRICLLLALVPISMLVNSLRIVGIGLAGAYTESAESMHAFHDYSGYISLAICAGLVWAVAWLLGLRSLRAFDQCVNKSIKPMHVDLWPIGLAIACLLLLAICGSVVGTMSDLPRGSLDRHSFPMSFGRWKGHELSLPSSTRMILSKGDLSSREYVDQTGIRGSIQVFLDAGYDLSAFHDPHICLPGSGISILTDKSIRLRLDKHTVIVAAKLRTRSESGNAIILHWYSCEGKSFAHMSDVSAYVYQRRLEDLEQLVQNPLRLRNITREFRNRQVVWHRFYADEASADTLVVFIREFMTYSDRAAETNSCDYRAAHVEDRRTKPTVCYSLPSICHRQLPSLTDVNVTSFIKLGEDPTIARLRS